MVDETKKKKSSSGDKWTKKSRNRNDSNRSASPNKKRKVEDRGKKADDHSRHRQRKHAEIVEEAKRLWNQLRQKNNTPEQTRELLDKLFPLITGKANQIAMQHDASRVVQAAIQFGRPDERKKILIELCAKNSEERSSSGPGNLVELSKSQYAHFVVLKLIKYCHKDPECVDMIIKSLRGHIAKLCIHAVASRVVEQLFRTLSPKQTIVLRQEFYGPHFSLFATDTVQKQAAAVPTLASNVAASPDKKEQAIEFVRGIVNKGIEKQLYGYVYFQELFAEYLDVVEPSNDLRTMLATAADHAIHLLSTRAGTRVCAAMVAYGSAKDRKRIMKSLKGYCRSGLLHRDAYLAIIRLVQLTDDTVSVHKNILIELLTQDDQGNEGVNKSSRSPLLDLALSDTASKLFLLLLPPDLESGKKFFDPYELSVLSPNPTILEDGIEISTSKKNCDIRRKELLKYLKEPLIALCADHTEELLRSRPGSLVLREVYFTFEPERLVDSCVDACLVELKLRGKYESGSGVDGMDQAISLFEDRIGHLAIKNLILIDAAKEGDDKQSANTFSHRLCHQLKAQSSLSVMLMDIAKSNRGAFVVAALCKVPSVRKEIVAELTGEKGSLKKRARAEGATAGFVALINEISSK